MHAALIILKIYGIKYFKIVFLNIYNCVYKIPFSKSGHILTFSYVCYIIYQGLFMSCRKQHLLKHYKPVYDSFSVDKDTCTLLESPFHAEMNGFCSYSIQYSIYTLRSYTVSIYFHYPTRDLQGSLRLMEYCN